MMLEEGVPNLATMLRITRSCSLMSKPQNFGCVRVWALKLGLDGVMEMYSKNGLVDGGLKVMIHYCISIGIGSFDPDAMVTLIHGCTGSGSFACGKDVREAQRSRGLDQTDAG